MNEDAAIRKMLEDNKIPALGLGIIRNGKLTQIKAYGEFRKGEAASYNTIYNVASLTKPVVAMLALRLASQGKWDLDKPLDKYWIDPDIKDDPRHSKITTHLILSHQTGFKNWRRMNSNKKLGFDFEPGTKYQYSGEAFEYLRKALENKFGTTIDKLAKEYVLDPLGMKDTHFLWDDTLESRIAIGYDKNAKAYDIVKRKTAIAADDIMTTIEDYAKFMIASANSEGLSKEVFADITRHQVKKGDNVYFGLGWEIFDLGDDYLLSHGGSDQGVQAQVFISPKTRDGLLIFTNADQGNRIYLKLVADIMGETGKKLIGKR